MNNVGNNALETGDLNDSKHQNEIFRMAKQTVKE